MRTKTLSGIVLLLVLGLFLPSEATAAVVGRFSQVEGKVELLKKGQLPATQVKLEDGLEKGDVIRTKSLSKAQITFIDKTTLTIAPESRITIEEYMVDEGKGKRNVVLQMVQGLALAVVSKIYQSEEPNFTVKTHTAVMGIRGTEVGIRLYPNFSEFLTFVGCTRVKSNLPEVPGDVEICHEQGTRVGRGLPPTMAFPVSAGDKQQFMNQLSGGLQARVCGRDGQTETCSTEGGNQQGAANSGNINIVSIPPTVKPAVQQALAAASEPVADTPPPVVQMVVVPPNEIKPRDEIKPPVDEIKPPVDEIKPPVIVPPVVESYSPNFPVIYGDYTMTSSQGHQNATYTGSLSLKNSTVQYTVVTQDPVTPGDFVKSSSGSITWTVTGTLPLISSTGGTNTYSGPLTVTGTTAGGTVFTFSLQATYTNGKLTFDTTGPLTGTYAPISKDITPDFTSPGSSHKVTPGSATITWTSTTTAASTLTKAAITPLAATAPVTTSLTTAISLPSTNVISAVNTLPTSPTLTTVTGPPGAAVAGNPGGPQGPATAAAKGLPVVAGGGPPGLTGNVPAVVGGGGSPGLSGGGSTVVASGGPPGLSGTAPGLSGSTPGLSKSGPPGLSGGGPPGQLKDKSK